MVDEKGGITPDDIRIAWVDPRSETPFIKMFLSKEAVAIAAVAASLGLGISYLTLPAIE